MIPSVSHSVNGTPANTGVLCFKADLLIWSKGPSLVNFNRSIKLAKPYPKCLSYMKNEASCVSEGASASTHTRMRDEILNMTVGSYYQGHSY